MKPLTKSRFKLGLECPNKLFYTGKKEYPSTKMDDTFLQALAQGGFQVEELARMHYPGGILIDSNNEKAGDYEALWRETQALLLQENVIIYEAAFLFDGMFVRTDILVKRGDSVELIEVKAKSFDPYEKYLFLGKRGGLNSSWKPYLFDVAFQKHVMELCFPFWEISSYIMMADKSKKASVDGLNQMFRVSKSAGKNKSKNGDGRTGILKKVDSLEETGDPVLGRKEVSDIVAKIHNNKFKYHDNLTFQEAIVLLKDVYQADKFANWPTSYGACKSCEFKCSDAQEAQNEEEGLKSGYKNCFSTLHNWSDNDFKRSNIFDVWSFRKGKKLFDQGVYFKDELTLEIMEIKEDAEKLSSSHRQWLQVEKEVAQDDTIFVLKDEMKEELDSWTYPLHFIDFETSAVALPFNKGTKPYEQIAFQFSHHVYHEDGRIEHESEYVNSQAGFFPNFEFIRKLKTALENDEGTILRYSSHENTILNAICTQIRTSGEQDREELMAFIQHISHSKKDSTRRWSGDRDMVDLWEVVKKYYYNPHTKGSNSIKAVLPAALYSSEYLRNKYSKSIGEIGLSSKNFLSDHVWLEMDGEDVKSPYKMLPALFADWTEEQIANTLSEIDDIDNGGAALTAYGKLQYTDMEQAEIDELTSSLLKYCELDTLAMVMIFEHFKEDLT